MSWEATTTHLMVDADGWLYRRPDPEDDAADYEHLGSIEDADCVTDDLADEYEALCDAWRRDVGAMQRDRDEHRDQMRAR